MASVTPARVAAAEILTQAREREAYARDILHDADELKDLAPLERAYAMKLVMGVVSTRGTLDECMNQYMKHPDKLMDKVRDALRISVFEILYLDKSASVAVSQGVELVRKKSARNAALANAVLRRVAEEADEFVAAYRDDEDRRIFVEGVGTAKLARRYGFPKWMAQLFIDEMGRDDAIILMRDSLSPAPVEIVPNLIKSSLEQVEAHLAEEGGELDETDHGSLIIRNSSVLADTPVFNAGLALVSDASAQHVARLATPAENGSFLEIGSGRATKSVMLQSNALSAHGKQSQIVGIDLFESKCNLATTRARTYGLQNTRFVAGDATDIPAIIEATGISKSYTGALIDAPCTGLGTLRRHPEIRWSMKPEDIETLADIGGRMLASAATCIKPGGFIVYATCTITHQENMDVVNSFLASEAGANFSLSSEEGVYVTPVVADGPDIHFAVKLLRS